MKTGQIERKTPDRKCSGQLRSALRGEPDRKRSTLWVRSAVTPVKQHSEKRNQDMTTAQLPERTGCARWIGPWPDITRATPKDIQTAIKQGNWCNSTDGLVKYQDGPLCPDHQPAA
jgi:hypothetical protein